jgi:hypothetical protein
VPLSNFLRFQHLFQVDAERCGNGLRLLAGQETKVDVLLELRQRHD